MTERKAFLVRIDPELHAALRRWADDELRSINAQVEYALREALRKAGRLPRKYREHDRRRDSRPGGPDHEG